MINPLAYIHPDAKLDPTVKIDPFTVVHKNVEIGEGTWIGSNVTIGFALIGDRVKLYSGVRIGEAGFGAAGSATGPVDVPQLGRVIIQDGVTVGANTCIDRGALAVSDSDLMADGIPKGPELGHALQRLLDFVLDDPARNTRDSLLRHVRAEP